MTSSTHETQTPDIAKLLDRDAASGKKKTFLQKLKAIREEYGYLLLCALIPAAIVYLLYLVRGIYPFGNASVLILDLNGQYVSFYEALHDILHGDADLFYSFSTNLGSEFMGIYDYYVASPFALVLACFPERWMLEGLLFVFILKTAICGLSMGIYLHKHSASEPNRLSVVVFSLLYSLSSYCIVQQHNSMWMDAVVWLPLLALGIESLIRYGKFRLYVFTLAITMWSNFYIGYMVVLFTIVYCFYDYFAHNQNNENNPLGEKNHFLKSVGRVLLWSVLAVGMAALVIFSAIYFLSFGKNEFSNADWSITQKFELFEFFYKLLPASYDTLRPAGRPFVYCGILTVLLVPAYFMNKKFTMREKIASAFLILFFIGCFATSSLDLIWHGFQKPNWINYRYSFMLIFFLVTLAYRAFDRIEFTSRKSLLGTTALIALYVLILPELADKFVLQYNGNDISTSEIRTFATIWLSIGCLFLYFIIISLYGKLKSRGKEIASVILVVLVCIELFLSGASDMQAMSKDLVYSSYSSYNDMIDTFRPIAYKVQDYDRGFYRMEKIYERKTNDNFALQMNGLSLSSSTFNASTLSFLGSMGYKHESFRSWYTYKNDKRNDPTDVYPTGTPVSDALLGVKYLIAKEDYTALYGDPLFTKDDYDYPEGYTPTGEYDVYVNPYALSLIYGVDDDWMYYNADDYSTPFERINAMITAMLGEDETVRVFVPAVQVGDIELDNLKVTPAGSNRNNDNHDYYTPLDSSATASMTITYAVPENVQMYYYVPSRYFRKTNVNGGIGCANNVVPLGASTSTEFVAKIEMQSSGKNLYIDQTGNPSLVYYLDMEVYADAMTRLAATQVTIDEDYRDSNLFGSVTTTKENQMMFTSIPYDEGWQIYVDGKPVETFKTADALVTFTIADTGEHRLELRYMPRLYSLGLSVTIVFILIYVALLVLYPFAKRIPVLRSIVGIPGEPLPELMTPERMAEIEPGDIGAEDIEPPEPPTETPPTKKK